MAVTTITTAWRRQRRRDRRMSPVRPLLLLACAALLVAGSMLFAAERQDSDEALRARQRIERGMEAMGETLGATLHDYAVWDEAVGHLVEDLDLGWADKNIGLWRATNSQVRHTLVIRPDGSVAYAVVDGERLDAFAPDHDGGLSALVSKARDLAGEAEEAVGFVTMGDLRLMAAAAAILPEDPAQRGKPTSVLVITWDLADHVAPKLSERMGLEVSLQDVGAHSMPLSNGAAEVARLHWDAPRPGTDFLARALPGMLAAFLLIATLSLGLWRQLAAAFRELQAAFRRIRATEQRQRLFLSTSPDLWLRVDSAGQILDSSAPPDGPLSDLQCARSIEQTFPSAAAQLHELVAQALDTGERLSQDLRVAERDLWLQTRLVRLNDHEVILTASDISYRKWAEAKLEQEAHFDGLTGLPNRRLVLDRLSRALASAERNGTAVAVMLLDLNDFKAVNDTLGHPAGDALLVEVGRRLSSAIRKTDTVGRMGGDEFLLLFTDLQDTSTAEQVAQKVLDQLCHPAELGGHEVRVSAVAGLSLFPGHGQNSEDLIKNADTALYYAKANSQQRVVRFSAEMKEQLQFRLTVERRLARAFQAGELYLCYQPLFDLAEDRIVAAEALVRWTPDDLPAMRPDIFIPIAESSGLIVEMGRWILHTACATAAGWRAQGHDLIIAVNMSPLQFRSDVVETVVAALAASGLAADRLEIEVTEGLLLDEENIAKLFELHALGVHLSIDDFGTGFSSLGYLRRVPFNTLKIDRSFIRDVIEKPADGKLARNILRMAADLGLRTVGEGVETAEQRALLQGWGCSCIQGYLISPPVPAERFVALLDQEQPALLTPG